MEYFKPVDPLVYLGTGEIFLPSPAGFLKLQVSRIPLDIWLNTWALSQNVQNMKRKISQLDRKIFTKLF